MDEVVFGVGSEDSDGVFESELFEGTMAQYEDNFGYYGPDWTFEEKLEAIREDPMNKGMVVKIFDQSPETVA